MVPERKVGMAVRIGVIGGLNMDIHLFGISEHPGPADFHAHHYLAEPGGKGANQARAAAKLGAEVLLVGRVGDDEFGHDCRDSATGDGVDTTYVKVTDGVRTGFVAIRLTEGHHHSIIYVPGANAHLAWKDVEAALPDLAGCDGVLVQAEVPGEVLAGITNWARESGVPLFLDPAPPEHVTLSAMRAATAITPDLEEGTALAGRSARSKLSPVLSARELVEAGARKVFLKLGADGVLMADTDGVLRIPTLTVDPVDETGAGDVFIAALSVYRAGGGDWHEAARFANAASALSVSRPGLALPAHDEVLQAMQQISPDVEQLLYRKQWRPVGNEKAPDK